MKLQHELCIASQLARSLLKVVVEEVCSFFSFGSFSLVSRLEVEDVLLVIWYADSGQVAGAYGEELHGVVAKQVDEAVVSDYGGEQFYDLCRRTFDTVRIWQWQRVVRCDAVGSLAALESSML